MNVFRVFLTEDEIVVREGLRNNIPWEQCGFTLVGDAPDGELALPRIRELRPDLLITDIRMPFMDGLALSELVQKELPETKIVILSGYDDFSYAQQAIRLGVDQYLLKPITKDKLVQALTELREKMQEELQEREYLQRFQQEAREYELFSRRRFMENLVNGKLHVPEIYEQAGTLGLNLSAQAYNVILLSLTGPGKGSSPVDGYTEALAAAEEQINLFFSEQGDLLLFRWSLPTYLVVVKGDSESIEKRSQDCVQSILDICTASGAEKSCYIACGTPVTRISALPACFAEANRLIACRHIFPEVHILTADTLPASRPEEAAVRADDKLLDPEHIIGFCRSGTAEELPDFVQQLRLRMGESAMASLLFVRYFAMSVYLAAEEYAECLGCTGEALSEFRRPEKLVTPETVTDYITSLLRRVLELRDKKSSKLRRELLVQAIRYIDQHYTEESISLNTVAREVNVSPNYLSAVFSQAEEETFVEYLTGKRIQEAKRLLRDTDRRTGEVALAVGYRDARYFSFVFKKATGLTPREYRSRGVT